MVWISFSWIISYRTSPSPPVRKPAMWPMPSWMERMLWCWAVRAPWASSPVQAVERGNWVLGRSKLQALDYLKLTAWPDSSFPLIQVSPFAWGSQWRLWTPWGGSLRRLSMPWSLNWWLPRAEVEGCVPQTFPLKSRECPWSLDSPRVSPFGFPANIFFFGLKTGCPAAHLLALDDSKFQCSSWQKGRGGAWWQSRSYTLDITTCCSLEAS